LWYFVFPWIMLIVCKKIQFHCPKLSLLLFASKLQHMKHVQNFMCLVSDLSELKFSFHIQLFIFYRFSKAWKLLLTKHLDLQSSISSNFNIRSSNYYLSIRSSVKIFSDKVYRFMICLKAKFYISPSIGSPQTNVKTHNNLAQKTCIYIHALPQ
jgi:hypothetical protein